MLINKNHFAEGVKVSPTPNKGGALNPTLLVVHDTAGALDYKGSVSWLCNPQAKASAHFVVGRKGEIVQLASCLVKTWHAGKSSYKGRQNVNDFSIGIEIANPGKLELTADGKAARASFGATYNIKTYALEQHTSPAHGFGWWMPYTQAQLDAVLNLSIAIRDRYNITSCAAHFEISPGRKIDVGPQFPLSWLKAKLEGRKDDCNLVEMEVSTPIRQWPSIFTQNVVGHVHEEHTVAELLSSGEFFPAGENLPQEWIDFPERKILWHKVRTHDETVGWVLATNVRMI